MKKRIKGDIKKLRRVINILERVKKKELGIRGKRKLDKLDEKYRIKRKGFNMVTEEPKQCASAKSAIIKKFEQRISQYKINNMFKPDQKKVYREFNRASTNTWKAQDAEESRLFWSDIWEC